MELRTATVGRVLSTLNLFDGEKIPNGVSGSSLEGCDMEREVME
jgi:hypothetical protein